MSTTAQEPNYLEVKRGIGSWLVTLDHKRIGVMYLVGILTALLVGGTFALLVRIELCPSGRDDRSRRTRTTSSSRCTARSWSSW